MSKTKEYGIPMICRRCVDGNVETKEYVIYKTDIVSIITKLYEVFDFDVLEYEIFILVIFTDDIVLAIVSNEGDATSCNISEMQSFATETVGNINSQDSMDNMRFFAVHNHPNAEIDFENPFEVVSSQADRDVAKRWQAILENNERVEYLGQFICCMNGFARVVARDDLFEYD